MKYRAVLDYGDDGWITATVPSVIGVISQGRTRDEALKNIKEALEGVITVRKERGWAIPEETEIEINAQTPNNFW